ncbi:MAG: alpha/beta fold hydrolase [Planctomycetota bacterium]|nr:alpha/beta fold hydrolase [Planctomycetota bacterium]
MTRSKKTIDPRYLSTLLLRARFPRQSLLVVVQVVCLAGPLLPADPPGRASLRRAAGRISRLYRDHVRLDYFLDASGQPHPVADRGDWEIRRTHILAGLTHVTGPVPGPTRRVPLKIEYLEQQSVDNSLRHKIRYQSEPGDQIVAYLFVPRQTTTRHPAVLCLQQTNSQGSVEAAGIRGAPDLAYARHLAQRGYVTLAPDYPGFGESQWDFSRPTNYGSGTMKAIWDNMRSIDLLQSLPVVDPDRIGVIGHSLGGHNAMFTAAWEPRLQVIVSNCGFTRFHKDDVPSWTGPRYMPRIATRFQNSADRIPWDFPEIIATFAPRPFLAIAPQRDSDFDFTGVQDSVAAARPIYQLYGKPDHLKAHYPDTPHAFPPAARALAYAFLDQYLKP